MTSLTNHQEVKAIFENKSTILCEGIYIPPELFKKLSPIDQKQYHGRKRGGFHE